MDIACETSEASSLALAASLQQQLVTKMKQGGALWAVFQMFLRGLKVIFRRFLFFKCCFLRFKVFSTLGAGWCFYRAG